MLLVSLASLPVRGQSLYWDANDVAAGAGAAPAGIWGTDNFWSTDPNGELATAAWTPGGIAIFSAGSDAVGAFSVTLSGVQSADALNFEEGSVTLAGATPGTNLIWNGQVSVAPGASATLNVLLSGTGGLVKSGGGLLTLGNTNDFSGNLNVTAGTLAFGNSANAADTYLGMIPAAFNQAAVTLQDSATLRLNAAIVTFAAKGATVFDLGVRSVTHVAWGDGLVFGFKDGHAESGDRHARPSERPNAARQ